MLAPTTALGTKELARELKTTFSKTVIMNSEMSKTDTFIGKNMVNLAN